MSDTQEDDSDIPDDADSSRSGVGEEGGYGKGGAVADLVAGGDGDDETCKNEEADSLEDFYAGKDAITLGRLSLRAGSESGGSNTEDVPVDPVTTSAGGPTTYISSKHKPTPMDFLSTSTMSKGG